MPPSKVSYALTKSINFDSEDLEVLDLALHFNPELRLAAFGVKIARAAGAHYPITSIEEIIALIPSGRFEGAGHIVTAESTRIFFPGEFLPVEDEADLLMKMHIAFMRCREETRKVMAIEPAIYRYVVDEFTAKPA
jgi:hypothetical protein